MVAPRPMLSISGWATSLSLGREATALPARCSTRGHAQSRTTRSKRWQAADHEVPRPCRHVDYAGGAGRQVH